MHHMDEEMALLVIGSARNVPALADRVLEGVCKMDWEAVLKTIGPHIRQRHDFVHLASFSSFRINQILIDILNPCYRSLITAIYLRWMRFGDLYDVRPLFRLLPDHYGFESTLAYGEMLLTSTGRRHRLHVPDHIIWRYLGPDLKKKWVTELDEDIRSAWLAEIAGTELGEQATRLAVPAYWRAALRCAKPI